MTQCRQNCLLILRSVERTYSDMSRDRTGRGGIKGREILKGSGPFKS